MVAFIRRSLCLVLLALLPLPVAAQTTDRSVDVGTRVDSLLTAYHDAGQFNGAALVAKGDDVLYTEGFGDAVMEWDVPNTPDTRFHVGSVTKQFTAALILSLVRDGQVALDSTVSTYLPDYTGPAADRVTIHHLLAHRSGIPSFTGFEDYQSRIMRLDWEPDSLVAEFSGKELEFEPGTQFSYSNSGYFLLGVIAEAVTGASYDAALRERVLQPAGIDSSAGYAHNRRVIEREAGGYVRAEDGYERATILDSSVPYAAGMMYATPRALHRWTRALHGGEVLPDSLVDAMTTPRSENGYGYGIAAQADTLGGTPVTVTQHGGGINGFSSALSYVRADADDAPDGAPAYTVAVLDNTSSPHTGQIASELQAILYGGTPDGPTEVNRTEVDLAPEVLERYTGVYAARPRPDFKLTITREGDQLYAQATGQQAFKIYPSSETRFFVKVVDAELEFTVTDDGSVPQLTLYQRGQEIPFARE